MMFVFFCYLKITNNHTHEQIVTQLKKISTFELFYY